MVVCIKHCYNVDKFNFAWFAHALYFIYGPFMSLKLEVKSLNLKAYNITVEVFTSLPWAEKAKKNAKGKLSSLSGDLTIEVPYEPMQSRLVPYILNTSEITPKKDDVFETIITQLHTGQKRIMFDQAIEFDYLQKFVHYLFHFKHIEQGFYDEKEESFFILFDQTLTEINKHEILILGDVSVDLDVGFFGMCESELIKHWNEHFFKPWVSNRFLSSSIFPVLSL